MVTIVRIPISTFLIYFAGYVIVHIGIGLWVKKTKESRDEELKNLNKILIPVFKWFPFIYVIFILLTLM